MNILFFSNCDFFDGFHRKNEICEISKGVTGRGGKVVCFTKPKFFLFYVMNFFLKRLERRNDVLVYGLFTLIPISLAFKNSFLLAAFVRFPIWLQVNFILLVNSINKADSVYWIYKPDQYRYIVEDSVPFVYLHYDNYCEDSNYFYNDFPDYKNYLELCLKESVASLCTSYSLRNSLSVKYCCDGVLYYPNAIVRDLIVNEISFESQKFKSTIGFVGKIDDTFDHLLIDYLLREFPDYNFVLIGPVTNDDVLGLTERYGNLSLVGYVDYSRLDEYLESFNLGICPYSLTDFNRFRNPLKIYEYFSRGLPVVSSECDADPTLKNFVSMASSYDDFAKKIIKELCENSIDKARSRVEWVKANCWDNRADYILSVLTERL